MSCTAASSYPSRWQPSCLLRCTLVVALFALQLPPAAESARILLAPFPAYSHISEMLHIGEGLLDRGHDVYVLTSPTLPELEKVRRSPIKVILYEAVEPDFYASQESVDVMMQETLTMTLREDFRVHTHGATEMCTNPLRDRRLYETLRGLRFDLALADTFPCGRCLLVLLHRLQIPYVNMVTCYEPWLSRNPALPSATPFNLADQAYGERMTFWERLRNLLDLLDWSAFTGVAYLEDDFLAEYFYETPPVPLNQLAGRALFWFIGLTPALDYPRPTMANEAFIGGLTAGPSEPLPADLEQFMNANPKGVVLVSFGSMAFSLPESFLRELLAGLERLDMNVIMRYPVDPPSDVPPHMKLLTWVPQNDLLGHSQCRLFITHCGANGQNEALYHGVPMLGLPLFAEQHYNAKRLEARGMGKALSIHTLTAAQLVDTVGEIVSNRTYKDNVLHASRIFKDQPMTPMETAIFWIEHVIKHGGQHMRAHALDMPWYEYLMLDILAFLHAVVLAVVITTACILWRIKSFVSGSRRKLKSQ